MIKVTTIKVEKHHGKTREVMVDLVADESVEVEEIGASGDTVVGLRKGDVLAMGSTCFTATMEFGMLDSTGNWRFQ